MFFQSANQGSIVTDTGEQQRLGPADTLRRIGALRFRAKLLERPLHRGNVSRPIVDQRHFHKSPFVLGRILRSRLSRVTAKRSALAKALNIASIW